MSALLPSILCELFPRLGAPLLVPHNQFDRNRWQ